MLHNILLTYKTIGLDALNNNLLLTNREDRKYIFPIKLLETVLLRCQENYAVLEIADNRMFDYRNTYFDTKDLSTYHQHHNGKKNRCKLRHRTYIQTNDSYFEIKTSNNKDKTTKERCKAQSINDASSLIAQHSPFKPIELSESLCIEYKRITLLHKIHTEKITLDIQMCCSRNENKISFDKLIFAEVKTMTGHDIEFCSIMKEMGIRTGSLSKYCIGIANLCKEVKQNNFKVSLKYIQTINAHATS
jgi:hypothetical protein